ncbi:MAG: helix-turn-helix transcriptional regulator [Ruminococcaceae bacterium]|nr:helix-turn-helix transcriptional regulator [Oscillospiraceae bacterium]
MKNQTNICKFVTQSSDSKMKTSNFVYETKNSVNVKRTEEHAIYLVTSGEGCLCTDLFKKELVTGTVFFTFSGIPFRIKQKEHIEYIYISFHGLRSQELFDRFQISPSNCIFRGHEGLLSFWQTALGKANESNLDLISESVLLYTFSQMTPTEGTKEQDLVSTLLSYIENHFTDTNLTLASTAEELRYNAKYISRVFKENVGISFSEYVKNIRIQHAVFLMEQGVTAVKNVALLSGFRDPFYFSNVFHQTLGMAPSDYLNKNK